MVASDIVGAAVPDAVFPCTIRSASETIVRQAQICKRARTPTQHVSLQLIDCIPTWCSQQASQDIPTFSLVNLGCTSNMKLWVLFKLQFTFLFVIDASAADSKTGVLGKVSKASLKVILREAEVCI